LIFNKQTTRENKEVTMTSISSFNDDYSRSKSVHFPTYEEGKTDWSVFSARAMAAANQGGFAGILNGTLLVVKEGDDFETVPDGEDAKGKGERLKNLKAQRANASAYGYLINAVGENLASPFFNIVQASTTADNPSGDARKAWVSLVDKYSLNDGIDVIASKEQLMQTPFPSKKANPLDWILELDMKRQRINHAIKTANPKMITEEISDAAFIEFITTKLPEDYKEEILWARDELTKTNAGTPITVEILRNRLHNVYKINAKLRGWKVGGHNTSTNRNESGLYVSEGQGKHKPSKKPWKKSKSICTNCGKIGHRAQDCFHKNKPNPPKQPTSPSKGGNKNSPSKFKGLCNWCNFEGHKLDECRKKQRGEPQSAAAIARVGRKSDQANLSTETEHVLFCIECEACADLHSSEKATKSDDSHKLSSEGSIKSVGSYEYSYEEAIKSENSYDLVKASSLIESSW